MKCKSVRKLIGFAEMTSLITSLLLGCVTIGLILCPLVEASEELPVVRVATGMKGGGYYDIGTWMEDLAESHGFRVEALETQGSWESLIYLRDGRADFALTQLNAFVKYSNYYLDTSIVVVRPLYTEYLHIVLRDPFEISSCASLVGKRIFFGRPGSGTAITANLFMDVMGLSAAQFPFVDAERFEDIQIMFRENDLDVAFHVGTVGNKVIRDLAESTKSSLFSLDRNTIRHLTTESRQEELGILGIEDIPAFTYNGQDGSITAIAVPVALVTLPFSAQSRVVGLTELVLEAIDSVQNEGIQGDMSLLHQSIRIASKHLYDADYYHVADYSEFYFVAELLSFVLLVLLLMWLFRHCSKKYLRAPRYRSIFLASCMFVGACIIAAGMVYFLESPVNESFGSFYETLWSMILYLTSRLAGRAPVTVGGRLFVVLLLLAGSVLGALITGFITSKIIFNKLERKMAKNQKDHFVILNWNIRALEVVRQIHSPDLKESSRNVVVVVTNDKELKIKDLEERLSTRISETDLHNVYFSPGDPTDEKCLANVNILEARTVLIMADDKQGQLADDQSMKSLMAVQSLLEKEASESSGGDVDGNGNGVHVVIELLNIQNSYTVEKISRLLPKTVTIDIVAQGQIRTLLLAQAAMIEGLVGFYQDMLSFDDRNNELYLVDIEGLSGQSLTFPRLASYVISLGGEQPVIPVGIQRTHATGQVQLVTNPKEYQTDEDKKHNRVNPLFLMEDGDKLLVIAYSRPLTIKLQENGIFKEEETVGS